MPNEPSFQRELDAHRKARREVHLGLDMYGRPIVKDGTGDVLRDTLNERLDAVKQRTEAEIESANQERKAVQEVRGRELRKINRLTAAQQASIDNKRSRDDAALERRKRREKDLDLY